jgi:protein FAM32A
MVVGGKLKLKGSAPNGSKKRTSAPPSSARTAMATSSVHADHPTDHTAVLTMTEAQKRHMRRKIEREEEEAKNLAKTSFRERVDKLNSTLASMTEHNDIPRISAAGNG